MASRGDFYGLLTRRVGEARLKAALPHLPKGGRVLDVGCGLTDLPGRVEGYVGCDRNLDVLAAQQREISEERFL